MKSKNLSIILAFFLAFIVGLMILFNMPYRNAERLVKAIKQENFEKIEKLLDSGVDPNVTTTSDITEFVLNIVESTGERPLSIACDIGSLEIVQMLIDYGATAEPYDKCGWSPLNQTLFHYQSDDKKIVELLIKNGADINEDSPFGLPIFNAAEMTPRQYDRKGNKGACYIGNYDEEVAKGITDIVEMLLEYGGYNINLKSSYNGSTLLISATKSGNLYLVEYLLANGCDVSAKDDFNKSAFDYAQSNQDFEMMKLLEETFNQGTVL